MTDLADQHVLRDLGFTVGRDGPEVHGTAAVVPEMCVPGTAVLRASILASCADMLTGLLAVDVVAPRVPVTLQLDVHLYAPPTSLERMRAVARTVKAGRSAIATETAFSDEAGRPFGTSSSVFMVAPDPNLTMPPGPHPIDLMAEAGGPLVVPFAERAGCQRRPPDGAVLPKRADTLNSAGTMQGGLLALVIEEAALTALGDTTLATLSMRYLRPVLDGPAVARAVVHGDVAEVTLHDEGRDDALAVAATARAFR